MLVKLLKYELKSSARTLLPLYLGILLVSVVCGFFVSDSIVKATGFFSDSAIGGLIILLLVALYVAMGVLTVVCIVGRFNNGMLGDEGFLMFTLPVSTTTLLSSKLITALIWCFCGGLVSFLSTVIIGGITFLSHPQYLNFRDFWHEFQMAMNDFTGNMVLSSVEIALLLALGTAVTILTAYLAMMIGQLEVFNRHQVAVSFVAFFLINWVFSWFSEPLSYLISTLNLHSFSSTLHLGVVVTLLQVVIIFFGVDYLMKKKLTL